MYAFVIILIAVLATFLLKQAFDKSILKSDLTLKTLSVLLCVLGIFRYFLSDSFVETVNLGNNVQQSILRWTYHIGYAVIPMSVFFSSRIFRNVAIYFSMPVALICAVFSEGTVAYFLANGAGGYYIDPWLRYIFYALELIIAIITPALLKVVEKHKIDFKNKDLIFESYDKDPKADNQVYIRKVKYIDLESGLITKAESYELDELVSYSVYYNYNFDEIEYNIGLREENKKMIIEESQKQEQQYEENQ